jgi:hypothetical protein
MAQGGIHALDQTAIEPTPPTAVKYPCDTAHERCLESKTNYPADDPFKGRSDPH